MPDLPGPQLTVSALGAVVRIVLPSDASPELVARVTDPWRGALVESVSADREVVLDATDNIEGMLEQLSVRVTLEALDHRRGDLIMFHAAGVALDDGRVLAFVGPSGRGKTTLSRELGKHFGYVSDETIGVDADLNVFPYRKPLSVVQDSGPKKQVGPVDAGLRDLPDAPLRLAALVLLDRDGQAPAPELASVDLLDALEATVPQLSYLGDVESALCRLALLVERVGGIQRLRYSDASDVPPIVPGLVRARSTGRWRPALGSVGRGELTIDADDAIASGGRIAVLSGGVVRVLSGIAPVIWQAVHDGRAFDGVVDSVTAAFGVPPRGEASALVANAVGELVSAGLLRRI